MESNENIFNILLATDCHLGFLENDAVRGADSLVTFEEILQIAVKKEVDFILFGGDLFHENKPSRKIIHDCFSLLRKYCMGDRPIQFEFLSDQSENFKHCSHPIVNFEDPNLNVAIPIFSIHGNHDDPAGAGCFCALDMLSASGLINYFGKYTELDNVSISPLLFQKGQSKLCLYGLGSIRDERLHRMFLDGKVTMLRPRENYEDWFNLMVLHQNRVKHGPKNYIPEQFLDNFLDLVVWGHEHECRIEREWNSEQEFYITQPGSSVATSLCHGEAVPKHVGLLQIRGKEFQITKIPLQTVRQFYIKDINLDETGLSFHEPDSKEKVIAYFSELVDQYLEKAEKEHSGNPKQPSLPLIRLRVFCPSDFDTFSVQRFGHSYVSKVANTKDIILFNRRKAEKIKPINVDGDALQKIFKQEGFDKERVEDLVKKYFEQTDNDKRLMVLSEIGVGRAVQEYVDKDVKESITALIEHQIKKAQGYLQVQDINVEDIDNELVKFRDERLKNVQAEVTEAQTILQQNTQRKRNDSSDLEDNFMMDAPVEISTKTRGRGRGRGGRGKGSVSESPSRAPASKRTSRAAARSVSASNSKKKGQQTDLSSFLTTQSKSVNYCEISDDENEYLQEPKRRKLTNQGRSSRRGIVFDDSD